MPAADGTLTVEDVALHLGVPPDQRMTAATDAARTYAEVHRINPAGLWYDPDVHLGGVLYAAALHQARVTPEGMAGFDPSVGGTDTYALVWRARQLLRLDAGFA